MNNLYNPIPFFTNNNVDETIAYVKIHAKKYTDIYINALGYVQSVLSDSPSISKTAQDMRFVQSAYAAAEAAHDKLIFEKDYFGGTRWRYIATAVMNYISMIERGTLK